MGSFIEFFGLKDDPFKITPDIEYFFLSQFHQEALISLNYLLKSGEGFAVIVGEPGTGKTITLRKFIHDLPENVEYAYILFPNLSPEEMLKAILEDFGLTDEVKDKNLSKNKLLSILRDFLISKKNENKKVLVIIDEAQNLPVETLEELRILSNLETDKEKLLQIIMSGQPELENKLDSPQLRQLKQRITLYVRFRNLHFDEMVNYITYRLAKAGNMNLEIDKRAYKLVYKYSKGNMRLINLIMERTLMAAYVDGSPTIKPQHVESAAESLNMIEKTSKNKAIIAVSIILILILIVAGIVGYTKYLNTAQTAQTTAQKSPPIPTPAPKTQKPPTQPPEKEEELSNIKEEAVVAFPVANLFKNPDNNAQVVAHLKRGEPVKVLETKDNWIKVAVKKDSKIVEGWIPSSHIVLKKDSPLPTESAQR
ncbi:MAG: AAA family ATPase [Aquificae bacterium]|nr:AAA family ATPase [Aquificota bacterium]